MAKWTVWAILGCAALVVAMSFFHGDADLLLHSGLLTGAAAVLLVVVALLDAGWSGSGQTHGRQALRVIALVLIAGLAVATTFVALNGPRHGEAEVVDDFINLALDKKIHFSKYRNAPCIQFPTDQWMMQEIIFEVEPDFIIETGTWYGATALYYADLLEKIKPEGKVITIDIEPMHEEINVADMWGDRVEFILGSSTDPAIVASIADRVKGSTVLVTLDSDHSTEHVSRELELYWPLVSVGSYIVVQDTFLEHDAWEPGRSGDLGPLEAVRRFLEARPEFFADRSRSRYLLTQHPFGYLKRLR